MRDHPQLYKKSACGRQIKPGGKPPSVRELTVEFGCSKNTAIHAYQMLEKEHLIYADPKSGYYAVLRGSSSENQSATSRNYYNGLQNRTFETVNILNSIEVLND